MLLFLIFMSTKQLLAEDTLLYQLFNATNREIKRNVDNIIKDYSYQVLHRTDT